MTDEEFKGAIWILAVPKAVVELAEEISAWQKQYGTVVSSPYTSESFGGYSYSKSGGSTKSEGVNGWQNVFRLRLNSYRKLREI